MPGSKLRLRKWSATEDRQLITSVNEFKAIGTAPDYRVIAKKIQHRSPKQCRERYENSLQPDVKRGEWSFEETLTLAQLMISYGQNWAAVKDKLKTRTYNAIKKKGRKLLGEIVDRNSIPKGTTTKARTNWTEDEFGKLLGIHLGEDTPEDKRNNYLYLALTLKSGRSEAEVERRLIQKCVCHNCSNINQQITTFLDCDVHYHIDASSFKEKWSLWKSGEVSKRLEFDGTDRKTKYRSNRRASTISTSSDSTMASSSSKRKRIEEDTFSQASEMSVHETFFPFEQQLLLGTAEAPFYALPATTTSIAETGYGWPSKKQKNGFKFAGDEFDLSFLFPL